MTSLSRCGAGLTGLLVCFGVSAAEPGPSANPSPREAYKYVDEKGRVVYSESPPSGVASKTVDLTPANSGRPGAATRSRSDNTSRSTSTRRDQSPESKQTSEDRMDAARQKELAELQAKNKCIRYGGEDCPDVLTRDPDPTQPLWRTKPPPEPRVIGR